MNRWRWVAAGLAVAIVGCAQPRGQESAELAARADEWQVHFSSGNVDGVADLYAEDARLLPPNGEMRQGPAAIRAELEGMIEAGLTGTLETVEAMTAGDLGYRVGTFTLDAADGSQADRGKFIEIWRRIDGEWKITNDIYNSDLEAGPAGELMIATHEVGDAEVWLAAWLGSETRRSQFADHGVASARVFQHPDNQAMTGLLLDVVDPEAFQAFLQSEEGAAAAAADTVDLEEVVVLQEVD
jgi:ketosteroid isomerase-like protein